MRYSAPGFDASNRLREIETQDVGMSARNTEVRCDLASCQQLPARSVNHMKLKTMLRVRFGIERYEISVR